MQNKDIKLFVCVPAVGKSYLEMSDDRFVDLDRLKGMYKYGYPEDMTYEAFEATKANRGKIVHNDTIEYIKKRTYEEMAKEKYLLYAPNSEVVDMIVEEKLPYCLVYVAKDGIDLLEKRMKDRGNIDKFIKSMMQIGYQMYEIHQNDPRPTCKIELKAGEYLSDVIYDFLEIERPNKKAKKRTSV